MRRGNNSTMLYVIIGILVLLAIFYLWKSSSKESEKYAKASKMAAGSAKPDIEYIAGSDHADSGDDFHLIQPADTEEAFALGFGRGEGIYGSSGRHTSEMIGN